MEIARLSSFAASDAASLVYAQDADSAIAAGKSGAGAVIAQAEVEGKSTLVSRHPKLAFARAWNAMQLKRPGGGVHPTAVVDSSAKLGEGVAIGPYAVIAPRVTLGPGTMVGAHAVLAPDVTVGEDSVIHAHVAVYPGTTVGERGDPEECDRRGTGRNRGPRNNRGRRHLGRAMRGSEWEGGSWERRVVLGNAGSSYKGVSEAAGRFGAVDEGEVVAVIVVGG